MNINIYKYCIGRESTHFFKKHQLLQIEHDKEEKETKKIHPKPSPFTQCDNDHAIHSYIF